MLTALTPSQSVDASRLEQSMSNQQVSLYFNVCRSYLKLMDTFAHKCAPLGALAF